MEFSRQEYWNGLPFPSPGDLPDLGIKPMSPALQADSLLSEPPEKPMKSNSEMKSLSRVRLFATPWTVAYQAPPSVGFSRHPDNLSVYFSQLYLPSFKAQLAATLLEKSPRFSNETSRGKDQGQTLSFEHR